MSLLSRLVAPGPGEVQIPIHQFQAALRELKRAAPGITVQSIATAFGLSAGEQTELQTLANSQFLDLIDAELFHDVLLLGERGYYPIETVQSRLEVVGNVPADIWSLITQRAFEVVAFGMAGNCVLAGCAVSAQGSPDMTLAVAKGAIISSNALRAVTAGNVTITTAHATLPRIDLVVVASDGTKTVRAGTPSARPVPAALVAGDVCLAFVYVPFTDTTISASQFLDTRIFSNGPVCIGKISTPVVRNNTSAAQAFITLTIPNGLFLTGRQIRVNMGGTMLLNSGTPTVTLRIAYGGTTMFQDVTGAATADTDRLAWTLDFTLTAQANNDQNLNGTLQLGALGAKTAPNTGTGDIAANGLSGVFNGASAVDSDSANRDLVVEFTMSVQNANNEIAMETATAELI